MQSDGGQRQKYLYQQQESFVIDRAREAPPPPIHVHLVSRLLRATFIFQSTVLSGWGYETV